MKYAQPIRLSRLFAILALSLAAPLVSALLTPAAAAPPTYDVEFIGGFPKAVNNSGHAVGWILENGVSRAWVYKDGNRSLLPVPANWHAQANDINDNGVIVGTAGSVGDANRAVIWRPLTGGYSMTEIDTPATDEDATALAINNFDDIVGKRTFLGALNPNQPGSLTFLTRGFRYSSSGELTANLNDIGFQAIPRDINDNGQIVGNGLRMTQSLVEDLGVPSVPLGQTRYIITFINAINNAAQVAAQTALATGSTLYTASRFSDSSGWQVLTLQGSFDAGLGINDGGDVTFEASFLCASGAGKPGVYIEGEGAFCLDNLLADSNWEMAGPIHESDINNNGQILLQGGNSVTSQSGALLLTPDNVTPPPPLPIAPAAPQNLAANVQTVSGQQTSNTVLLNWVDASDNETGFRLERRPVGTSAWSLIALLGDGVQDYADDSVDFDRTYEYRVFALNAGGDSLSSNLVTAVSPAAPSLPLEVAPNAPQNLTTSVLAASSSQPGNIVQLSWNDVSDNETNFIVERQEAGGAWNNIATLAADSTRFDDNTAAFESGYEYRVIATNAAGDSAASNVSTVFSPAAPSSSVNPPASTNPSVGSGSSSGIGSLNLYALLLLVLVVPFCRANSTQAVQKPSMN